MSEVARAHEGADSTDAGQTGRFRLSPPVRFPGEIEGFRSLRLRLAPVRQHETLRFGESSGRL